MIATLLILQSFHVIFLATHDWVPLGKLNNVDAVRAANPGSRLFFATLISTIPYAFGLAASASYMGGVFPGWLKEWLWVSYTLLFLGEIVAWWIPYLFGTGSARAARYETMFGNTYAFLPARHGIRPNTLHVILHLATAATLAVLCILAI